MGEWFCSRGCSWGPAVLVLVLAAGCSDDLPWQALAAEDARALGLREGVPIVRVTREEYAVQAAARAAGISDDYLQYYADTYGRLGYFDRDLDLRPVFAGSSSDWVGATYSPNAKQITLVGEAPDQTLVHEFVHALQDQHFDLRAYDDLATSDGFLARRAVVEGDAVLAEYRFAMQQEGRDLDAVDWARSLSAMRDFSARMVAEARYPLVFLDYVTFVYSYGLEYTAANLTGVSYDTPDTLAAAPHDWALEDALFREQPPASTSQILRRDVRGEGAPPVAAIGLTGVPGALSERLVSLDWDVLGEWYVYLLLYPLEAEGRVADARALGAGWRGDRALFVRDLETGLVGTVWASAWADEATAQAMADALWMIYEGAPTDVSLPAQGAAGDGEPLWIERRGDRLVAARNVPADVVASLVEAAFAPPAQPALRRNPSLPAMVDRLRRVRGDTGCLDVLHVPDLSGRAGGLQVGGHAL